MNRLNEVNLCIAVQCSRLAHCQLNFRQEIHFFLSGPLLLRKCDRYFWTKIYLCPDKDYQV